jgi:uncharacterized protein
MKEESLEKLVVEITTTGLCNLNCNYCFEGEKKEENRLNMDSLNNILINIFNYTDTDYFKKNYSGILITFWGGEPTLRIDLIIETFRFCKDYLNYVKNIPLNFLLYTNGYDRNKLEQVVKASRTTGFEEDFQIQISYDGKIFNDMNRLTYNKETTSYTVMSNFMYLAKDLLFQGMLSLKATIPTILQNEDDIVRTWKEYNNIFVIINNLNLKNKNIIVSYGPTIDYTKPLAFRIKETGPKLLTEVLSNFKNQMEIIAGLEYNFYKEYGKFLMSWFSNKNIKDNRNHCRAGSQLITIHTDGSLNYCHGSLYIKDNEALKSNKIDFRNFLDTEETILLNEEITNFLSYFKEHNQNYYNDNKNENCKTCVATYCNVCPAALYEFNKKEIKYNTTYENLYSNNSEYLNCEFFKIFGIIDRSLQTILKNQKGD